MKTRSILLAALIAVAAAPAIAQEHDRREGDRGGYRHEGDRGGDRGDFRRDGDRGGYRDGDRRFDRRPGFDRPGFDRPRYPAYAYPRGYGYRRWAPGAFLPGPLFGASFYFNDFGRFGFAPPPYGFRWVRYGPDLLLVNVRTGRVRDVRYGVFG